MTKRITSIILTVTILLSMCYIGNISVSASSQRDDIVSIARSKIGYHGRPNTFTYWYGSISGYPDNGYSYPWCATFVSWCANQAGVSTDIIPKHASCTVGMNWFKNNGLWQYGAYYGGSYTPKAGDIVYYSDNYSQSNSTHVGIVTGLNGNYLTVVEGNTDGNRVTEYTANSKRTLSSGYVLGYGTPKYKNTYTYADLGTDFYAYITNTAYWLYLSNDSHNVSARSATYLTEQIWKFEKQSDGSYLIKSSKDDTCLDVADAIAQNSTNVQTCAYNGCDAQKWYFISAGDNKYIIKSKLGDYVLDLAGGSNVSGTNIQIYEPNGTDAQYFSVHRYEPPATTNINVEVDGTSVRVNWDIVNGCARYDVYLLQSPWGWDDIKYSKQIDFSMNYCEFKDVTPGNYAAFVVTKPNDNSKQSTWVDFTVNYDDLKPDNQIIYNGHIYTLYNDTLTWDEAKSQCEAMGGHLVTVTSAEEQTIIENLVKDQFCKWYFMGATNIDNGTDYKWVTGEKLEYTNWKNGSPDNSNEHYMMATTKLNGGWQDTVVDGYGCLVGFICEVETQNIKSIKESVFNGHKYELYDDVLTWEDAKALAELKGGHLVTVTSEKEKQFLDSLLQNGSQPYYWLGGTGDNINGFNWTNDEEFSYSNWANGEPNNSNYIESYIMQYQNSSEWNDSSNYQYLTGFVIEYDDYALLGDTNLDGTVSVDDVTYLQMHLARYTDDDSNALINEADKAGLYIADIDEDGMLTISDATALQMILAGYEL